MRVYKRKTDRQNWSEEDMRNAIQMAIRKEKGLRSISIQFNLPKSTLEDRMKKIKKGCTIAEAAKKGLGRLTTVFNIEQERQLKQLMQETQSFNPTQKDLRRIAFEFAVKHKIPHRFNTKEGLAGSDWFRGFMERHTDFTVKRKQWKRKPNQTTTQFKHEAVKQFFDTLQKLMHQHKFEPSKVYNADEIGLVTNAAGQSEIIALKENASLAEHDKLVTAVICYSATRAFVPPKLNICPGYQMKLVSNEIVSPENTWTQMQSDSFVDWMKHFIKHVKPSQKDPVLLLLNKRYVNHSVESFSRDNGVILLGIPLVMAPNLQPLDVNFMGSLRHFYDVEVTSWMQENAGKVVISVQMCSLFGAAYCRARDKAVETDAGFERTGILPLNTTVGEQASQSTRFQEVYVPEHEEIDDTVSETSDVDI